MKIYSDMGILVVITGASGAGKDTVMAKFLADPVISELNLKRIVTCTDRPPRPGETDGVDYHFLTHNQLLEMEKQGKLVEPVTPTGSSNKATPRFEIERLFSGKNIIWRIDPSRAAEVASGNFYKRLFPEKSETLQEHTLVLFINASKEDIIARRKARDKDSYNPKEYEIRDNQEKPYLEILNKSAISILNLQNKINETVADMANKVREFNKNVKEK